MKVTSIRMRKLNTSKFLASATLTIDNAVALPGIRLGKREDSGELFILMPTTAGKDDKLYENFHPINSEARAALQDAVITHYEKLCEDESLSGKLVQLSDESDFKITNISVTPMTYDQSPLRAFANVTIDDAIVLRSIRLIQHEDHSFSVHMPTYRRRGDDSEAKPRYIDCYHPITHEARSAIEDAVVAAYSSLDDPAE